MEYAASVTHTSPINSKYRLSCRDQYFAKMVETSNLDMVNNVNNVSSDGWSILTVYCGT